MRRRRTPSPEGSARLRKAGSMPAEMSHSLMSATSMGSLRFSRELNPEVEISVHPGMEAVRAQRDAFRASTHKLTGAKLAGADARRSDFLYKRRDEAHRRNVEGMKRGAAVRRRKLEIEMGAHAVSATDITEQEEYELKLQQWRIEKLEHQKALHSAELDRRRDMNAMKREGIASLATVAMQASLALKKAHAQRALRDAACEFREKAAARQAWNEERRQQFENRRLAALESEDATAGPRARARIERKIARARAVRVERQSRSGKILSSSGRPRRPGTPPESAQLFAETAPEFFSPERAAAELPEEPRPPPFLSEPEADLIETLEGETAATRAEEAASRPRPWDKAGKSREQLRMRPMWRHAGSPLGDLQPPNKPLY